MTPAERALPGVEAAGPWGVEESLVLVFVGGVPLLAGILLMLSGGDELDENRHAMWPSP